ncbi:hypothetical protein BTHE68_04190 [Burkholderia sp. THE68]|uniref:flavin monoamine oxidase family protein n=1 Tax=Burkholderia sp. THE68 TaxID=758782 RepID=UPI00131791EF|nr:FAD-dependent oxidoreductase [Burkholderia sp. THE68]BBU26685.1 hypothetical protein BTHE68_04190 [Burkholderia sp. THE68]
MEKPEGVAIVGAGITGLLCALALQRQKKSFVIYESTGRVGGRIRTVRLRKDGTEWHDFSKDAEHVDVAKELDFAAEFGPMRLECDIQHLLKALLLKYGITEAPPEDGAWKPYLTDFSSPSSPSTSREPKYSLPESEDGKTPLELLSLAMLRIIRLASFGADTTLTRKQDALLDEIEELRGQYHRYDDVFHAWLKTLDDQDYWDIQVNGFWHENPKLARSRLKKSLTPLSQMGFWNLLSDVLHHNAIMKIRDLGTFYHLLPDNPNAAEWLIWWLRILAFGENLQGLAGGMETIIEKMVADLPEDAIELDRTVKSLEKADGGWRLRFIDDSTVLHERVILTLPAKPLGEIVRSSLIDLKKVEPDIDELVSSAFGFPMVKVFAVVDKVFWKKEQQANELATSMPTRELHYWRSEITERGMIMAYTDRPATSFWSNYVAPGPQQDATTYAKNAAATRLKMKVLNYIRLGGGANVDHKNIVWYGIRDWGRDPYGAANHAWRPERRYWVVMRRLAQLGPDGSPDTIHICGEAYSDYHGFMEGSLRSAVYALHRMFRAEGQANLEWIDGLFFAEADACERDLFKPKLAQLKNWVDRLDRITPNDDFIIHERGRGTAPMR